MSDRPDYDNPTEEDVKQFTKALLKKVRFEPILDQDFDRSAEKLEALIEESRGFAIRLSNVWKDYDKLRRKLSGLGSILRELEPARDAMMQFGFAPELIRAVEPDWAAEHLGLNEDQHRDFLEFKSLAQKISGDLTSLSPADVALHLNVSESQIVIGPLFIFLLGVTPRLAKGTAQVYDKSWILDGTKEVVST